MSTAELVIVGLSTAVLAVAFAAAVASAARGADLRTFEAMRGGDPRRFRALVWSCRLNGPLVALFSSAAVLASPFVAIADGGGVALALACAGFFSVMLWLSLRWFLWSLRA